MKATGEVMAIAPNFEAALMKAVRGAEISLDTLNAEPADSRDLEHRLSDVDDRRIFTVFEALKIGMSVQRIHELTRIDKWFLFKLQGMAEFELDLAAGGRTPDLYEKGKRMGYPDAALERISGCKAPLHRDFSYKMVDTCGAEFEAETPYFYSVYGGECESRSFVRSGRPTVVVLGSGPYG